MIVFRPVNFVISVLQMGLLFLQASAISNTKIKGPTDKAFAKPVRQRFSRGLTFISISSESDSGTFL